jgi:UDPglucose 6-dehydrogenase
MWARPRPAPPVARRTVPPRAVPPPSGDARVKAHDPVAMERLRREHPRSGISCCATPEDAARDADALVLVAAWPQHSELPWEALAGEMRRPIVLDGRNFLDRARLSRSGFHYIGLGA